MKKLIIVLCFLPFLLPAQEYGARVRVQPTGTFPGGTVQSLAAWITGGSGPYLPLTLTGTTEVNTAGNQLNFLSSGALDAVFKTSLATSESVIYVNNDLNNGVRLRQYGSTATGTMLGGAIARANNGGLFKSGSSNQMVIDVVTSDPLYIGGANGIAVTVGNGTTRSLRVHGTAQIDSTANGDGITLAAFNSSNILTSVTIDGSGNSGLLFDDGALTLSNNLSEVADTITRTLGTGLQIYANGYAAYSGSGFSYASGRITNGSGASRICKIRYYFTAETAGLLTDALTVRVMIWDGATYTEHRAGRLTLTLNDDWELTGAKETIITLPDGDGVNIAFDSTDGLDISNFGYVIEKI